MIKQLAHACIYSTDLKKTGHFYTEALGLDLGFEFIKDGELFGYYINLGNNTFIEVFKGEPGIPGNINHLAIEVEDLDSVIEQVKAAGYEIGEKTLGADHAWQAWTEDPGGTRIEFHEYTAESLQRTGGSCIVDW